MKHAWKNLIDLHGNIVKQYKVVGSSMAIIKEGKLAFEQHLGYADKTTKRKTDINTIYHWASVTKTFTGIAIMQLRDQKKLKLSDPIIKYIPELKEMKNPYGRMSDITILHILTHSAGFRCDTWPHDMDKAGTWNDLMNSMSGFKILFKPGSKFSYSNLAINFLGKTIERISDMAYEEYIKKNIFIPLNMTHSYFNNTPKKFLKYRSNNYSIRDGKTITNGFDFETGVTVANGGLNAPCTDMVKYMDFLCNGGSILKRSSLEEMWKPHLLIGKEGSIKLHIGLSFFLLNYKKKMFIGHTGSTLGYICFMYINPKSKTGAVVNFNTAGKNKNPDTRKGLYELRKNLFDKLIP